MARVLLAVADTSLGIQLQATLESLGAEVRWEAGFVDGPGAAVGLGERLEDVVVLDADALGERLPTVTQAWRAIDPAPALVAVGPAVHADDAARARVLLVHGDADAAALAAAADEALRHRFAGALTPAMARRALGLVAAPDPLTDAARVVHAARTLALELPREALRWHALHYACARDLAGALRDARALTPAEAELVATLDGTTTVQTAVRHGALPPPAAMRLVWALASVGAVTLTPEPCDLATPRRRALAHLRTHLRARHARLASATYYDVLEIVPTADDRHTDVAVAMLARRFAPTVLSAWDLADLAPLAEPTWQQVEKARAVMHDLPTRARYNDWLRARWGALRSTWAIEHAAALAGAEAWQRAQQALGGGDVHRAVGELAAAARHHGGHPEYELNLAWSRYRVAADRPDVDRAAAARRERAAAEGFAWGTRPWPRGLLALALLAAADGDPESARWHLGEALQVEPSMPAARALLARLERR